MLSVLISEFSSIGFLVKNIPFNAINSRAEANTAVKKEDLRASDLFFNSLLSPNLPKTNSKR